MTTARAVSLDALKFRRIRECDYNGIVELISHEGWFILEKSKLEQIVHLLEPVFYVVVDESANDQIIGVAGVCKARDGEVMLGDVIIRDGFRRRGIGRFMMQNMLKLKVCSDVIVTFFSTTDAFYKTVGCKPCGQAAIFGDVTVDREMVEIYCQEKKLEDGIRIKTFTEDRKEELIRYDAGARGYLAERSSCLTIATSDFVAMAVKGREERIVGYMGNCLEPAGSLLANGFYADDETIAAHLLRKTLKNISSVQRLRFYTLDTRQFLAELGHLNMSAKHARLSYGGIPVKIPEEKLYSFNQPDLCY